MLHHLETATIMQKVGREWGENLTDGLFFTILPLNGEKRGKNGESMARIKV